MPEETDIDKGKNIMAINIDRYEISSPDHTIALSECLKIDSPGRTSIIPDVRKLGRALHHAAKVISIPALALVIIVGVFESIMTPSLEIILQAILFISGFVFLALAVDSEKPSTGWLLAATGITLPVLARLSTSGSQVFTITAVFLISLWVTAAIRRK